MSQSVEPQRPFFSFGNPFWMISRKGSQLSPKLLSSLKAFEETLLKRLSKLNPKNKDDVLSLSWMRSAMESLCETHMDIKTLMTELELPVTDCGEEWMDVYLDITVKLLDLCNAFSSELTRLNQGHLTLQFALHNLKSESSKQLMKAQSSLDNWRQHISSRNPRLEKCYPILDDFVVEPLDLPKGKKSAKRKVLMHAMFGVKMQTVLVCSIFAATFSGSSKDLSSLTVPDTILWAEAFSNLQANLNREIQGISTSGNVALLKEMNAVDSIVKKLSPMIQDVSEINKSSELQECVLDLANEAEKLSQGLNAVSKEVDGFFKIVLAARDALLSNFRVAGALTNTKLGSSHKGIKVGV